MNEERFINELFEKHYRRLLTYCIVKLKNDEQLGSDAADSVFFIAMQKKQQLANHPDPERWLFKTANYAINDIRKKNRRSRRRFVLLDPAALNATVDSIERSIRFDETLPWNTIEHADAESEALDSEKEHIKEAVLSALSHEERTLFELRFEQKRSIAEIADLCGLSISAVKMRISRIKLKIKDRIKIYF